MTAANQASPLHLHRRGFTEISNLLDHDWCRDLAKRVQQHKLLARIIPKTHVAVQCTYFEKSTEANWLVPPHQDRCIPIARRVENPDLGAWSEKEGQLYVAAPDALLGRMVAVRLHLDPCGADDGPLKIGDHVCLAGPGDAIVMCPLAVHSSSKATGSSRRRVLHFLFGPAVPGYGLEWR